MVLYSSGSSVNSFIVVREDILSPISFTYRRNINSPNTVSCGTQERTWESVEVAPMRTTLCCRWHNHASIHLLVFPVIP